MIDKTFVITVREAPKSVNAKGGGVGQHWGATHREKQRLQGLYLMELLAAKVPKPMEFCTVSVTVRWKRRNHRDLENYRHPVTKPLLDALVKGGYLKDDTEEQVAVGDFSFEYPQEWPYVDPRVTGETIIKLEAQYL